MVMAGEGSARGPHTKETRKMKTPKALIAAALLLAATSAFARDVLFTKEQIDKLPQDAVRAIRRDCAQLFQDSFALRLGCENNEYTSMQILIDHGSLQE
jgi:hypothetical protein